MALITSDISIYQCCAHTVHIINLSLLLMSSVIFNFTASYIFYSDVSGRLVLLFLKKLIE